MPFEEFSVQLNPLENSPLYSGNDIASLQKFVGEVQVAWPTLCHDTIEEEHCFPPKGVGSVILVSETTKGLFQVLVWLGNLHEDDIRIYLRFAYTNPPSVYGPVFSFIEWAMYKYKLYCYVLPDLAPDQQVNAREITSPKVIRSILLPSIEYNRKLWQWDAQTEEEASIRPGDAVAKFIWPLTVPDVQH